MGNVEEHGATAAAEVRSAAAERLRSAAAEIVAASEAMVEPLRAGATLHCAGTGISAVDAAHVAVEFVHPVIVGKRSIPARTVDPARRLLAAAGDVVVGLRLDDDRFTAGTLASARAARCLTVDVHASATAADADHVVDVGCGDPLIAREHHVTAYHLLWELVHEFLDAGTATDDAAPDGLSSLYPFLYEGETAQDDVAEHAAASARSKIDEIVSLRNEVLVDRGGAVSAAASALRTAAAAGGRVWTFGNGGSSTDAHALAHLLGSEQLDGAPVAASALTEDIATVTALANDVGFDVVFARMLRSLGRAGDVAVGLSTSGGSANVLAGLDAARSLGMVTIGFAGYDGGDMAHLDGLDHLLVVPSSSVHRIQEAQTTLLHVLTELSR